MRVREFSDEVARRRQLLVNNNKKRNNNNSGNNNNNNKRKIIIIKHLGDKCLLATVVQTEIDNSPAFRVSSWSRIIPMQIIIIIIQLVFLHRLKYHNQKSERVQSSSNERELARRKKTKRQRKTKIKVVVNRKS